MKRKLLLILMVVMMLIGSIQNIMAQETPTATITASRLNFRTEPGTTGEVILQVNRGQTYPILAVNRSNGWLQLSVNSIPGWINETFAVVNTLAGVPVIQGDRLLPESPTNTIATINAGRLNVRSGPGVQFDILTKVSKGETYTVVGRNASSTWIQIFANGITGWVNRGWTTASRSSILNVPIIEGSVIAPTNPAPPPLPRGRVEQQPPPIPAGTPTATITASRLNVRAEPGTTGEVILQVNRGQVYPILAANQSNGWLQISVNGIPGWINENFAIRSTLEGVPVIQADRLLPESPTNTIATVTASFLNVRSGPSPQFEALTVVGKGETYTVVGRNRNSTWIQIFANGINGWVNRGWTTASRSSILNVPIVAD